MNSLQTYINRYGRVISNLGISGESAEVLKQLLANATYISEVELATYMAEASLEKATLINSKIQHCVNNMYSVFRGSCPRVIMKIKPTKYLTLKPFDPLIVSQNFSIYYLGYYQVKNEKGEVIFGGSSKEEVDEEEKGKKPVKIIDTNDLGKDLSNNGTVPEENGALSIEDLLEVEGNKGEWVESSATFYPALGDEDIQIIKAFIAPKRIGEGMTINKIFRSTNTYYVDCPLDKLSDDVCIEINGAIQPRTRVFSDHILNHSIFDLTLPGFGSRLYVANFFKDTIERSSQSVEGITENTTLRARYFGYSELDDYNDTELNRIRLDGAEFIAYKGNSKFLLSEQLVEKVKGVCFIEAIPHDNLNTIHYKANRDRYVSSILRSNSDIGVVLEETFPTIVKSGGTSYYFHFPEGGKKSAVEIYYIPKEDNVVLSPKQIKEFISQKRAYYVITSSININPGTKYVASFDINAELYKHADDTDFSREIGQEILKSGYEKKFGVIFNETELKNIESLISKISNIKRISGISVTYTDTTGRVVNPSKIDPNSSYFDIKYSITTSVTAQ